MSDERTLRLAYRPVSSELLQRYVRCVEAELAGKASADALQVAGLAADDAARLTAAANAFCRPRLLKRRLSRAAPQSLELRQKQQEELARPIDDSDFIGRYGEETHAVFLAAEAVLVGLRARQVGE